MSKSRNLSRFQKKSIFKAKHLRSSTRQVAEAISKERQLCYTPPEKKKSYSWLPHSREIPQLRAWKHPGINVQMMRPDLKEVFAERFWTSLTNTVSFWEPAVLNFLIESHQGPRGLKRSVYPRMTLNSWSSFLYFWEQAGTTQLVFISLPPPLQLSLHVSKWILNFYTLKTRDMIKKKKKSGLELKNKCTKELLCVDFCLYFYMIVY